VSGSHHQHGSVAGAHRSRLAVVLAITLAILAAEVVGGLLAHSLVLLADAAHMGADAAGIGLSLLAIIWATRPPTLARTFGLQRLEILAAVVNAVLLLVLSVLLVVEAIRRLVTPSEPAPLTMLLLGLLALAGDGASLLLLRHAQEDSLNLRGAYLEVLADLLGAVGVIVAAAVIWLTGWDRVDPIASLAISVLIVPRTLRMLRAAVDVLLEATPDHVDLQEVRAHILETPGVVGCHDLHAWTITSGHAVLSAHVVVADGLWRSGEASGVLDRLGECLTGHFDLEHSTFQLEPPGHLDHEAVLHD
jgi:cobalt-zinc-cadmium efflux system protein